MSSHVGGDVDYRLRVLRRGDIYRTAGGIEDLIGSFRALCHADPVRDEDVIVNDRPIRAPGTAPKTRCGSTFDALCRGPRSQNDYIELARLYATVVVHGVPVFDAEAESENAAPPLHQPGRRVLRPQRQGPVHGGGTGRRAILR